ncbi:unnamed protein product [Acanthoscelides obtectus]|uniref:Uncharacterized protein n=1 Tax=Acanthoscelides obtectus TaxID=200917 RepID=A0A9P0PPA4_ACAOB|nr:unnamed protein product [Acanthoscelides obtectus]CAK1664188.1 hypothetical protein AOBTE_LOCUS24109 [Acanthoscelides obtectus]
MKFLHSNCMKHYKIDHVIFFFFDSVNCVVTGKPSTSASYQQLGEVCSVTTSQPGNLDVTTVEPIEEHYLEAK